MSATAIEAFLKAAKGDLTLKTKLGEADGAAAVVELAKEAGFDFSVSALKRYQHTYVSKLSDEELVEGSWNTRACCATWETPWQYDMLVA